MQRSSSGPALLLALLLGTSCLEVDRTHYQIDLSSRTGVLTFDNIHSESEDPAELISQFTWLIEGAYLGSYLEEEHPRWQIQSKSLEVVDGQLQGTVQFTFESLADVGLHQGHRKNPYVYCERQDGMTLVSSNGTLPPALTGCSVWDPKTPVLEWVSEPGADEMMLPSEDAEEDSSEEEERVSPFAEYYGEWVLDGSPRDPRFSSIYDGYDFSLRRQELSSLVQSLKLTLSSQDAPPDSLPPVPRPLSELSPEPVDWPETEALPESYQQIGFQHFGDAIYGSVWGETDEEGLWVYGALDLDGDGELARYRCLSSDWSDERCGWMTPEEVQ